MRKYAWILVIAVLILAGWGIFSRIETRDELTKSAVDLAIPTVQVFQPNHARESDWLVLPANVQAYIDAPIYARSSGYLRARFVDIGSRVKQGQLLAQIDTPEVTQQIRQAAADLATAQANDELAQVTAKRWKGLLGTDSVSKQDADQKIGDAAAKRAALGSAQANLERLRDLGSYQRIFAPFDGVITARGTDVGALVTAGSGPGTGAELFHIASIDRLRVYVNVPQPYAPFIRVGGAAQLRIPEHPGSVYDAKVVSTSESLDLISRTLLTQLEVDNRKSQIRPGSYGEARFELPQAESVLRIPANSLLFRSDGLSAVTIDSDNKMQIKPLTLGRDFGKEVEVISGLNANDRVVVNPPDSSMNGIVVRLAVR